MSHSQQSTLRTFPAFSVTTAEALALEFFYDEEPFDPNFGFNYKGLFTATREDEEEHIGIAFELRGWNHLPSAVTTFCHHPEESAVVVRCEEDYYLFLFDDVESMRSALPQMQKYFSRRWRL